LHYISKMPIQIFIKRKSREVILCSDDFILTDINILFIQCK
jgi:hypothetical protein